jgi:hypothetical protein
VASWAAEGGSTLPNYKAWEYNGLTCDAVYRWGDERDLVIGLPLKTHDGHLIETSYFAGQDKPKGIVVISSQASCPLSCHFCELGRERFGRNLNGWELAAQLHFMRDELRRQGIYLQHIPTKLTVANSGEPLLNSDLIGHLGGLSHGFQSVKVSTVLPDLPIAWANLQKLALKAQSPGFSNRQPIQLQISLISTDESVRFAEGGPRLAGFEAIRFAAETWIPGRLLYPVRKVNLSLLVTRDMPCDASEAIKHFPPELFRFRLREYVPTANGSWNRIEPPEPGRFAEIVADFAAHGYEVSDAGRPTPTERKFGLVANSIRRLYRQQTSR